MRYTEIKYEYQGKQCYTNVFESDITSGSISYPEAVINRLESITDSGAKIVEINQLKTN